MGVAVGYKHFRMALLWCLWLLQLTVLTFAYTDSGFVVVFCMHSLTLCLLVYLHHHLQHKLTTPMGFEGVHFWQ